MTVIPTFRTLRHRMIALLVFAVSWNVAFAAMSWNDAYTAANDVVEQMTFGEKASLTLGIGW